MEFRQAVTIRSEMLLPRAPLRICDLHMRSMCTCVRYTRRYEETCVTSALHLRITDYTLHVDRDLYGKAEERAQCIGFGRRSIILMIIHEKTYLQLPRSCYINERKVIHVSRTLKTLSRERRVRSARGCSERNGKQRIAIASDCMRSLRP